MINWNKHLLIIGLLGALAVSLGALGAHWLKNQLPGGLITVDQLNGFDTAVKYQMYHTLAMLLVVILKDKLQSKFLSWAYNCFLIGIIMFSGSLYFLCTRNLYNADFLKFLGPVTPLGGLFFVAGWIFLGISAMKKETRN
ncbi:MAG: hypothetical protein K0S32_2555 [Bacteroidetes bacterium]|jgi:uncharacterized membrane protein YgdD (TMEM256/DUF423 family)|nr:hypothetical protein [Bacteroidota bacterium]